MGWNSQTPNSIKHASINHNPRKTMESQYANASLTHYRANEEHLKNQEELYEAGKLWGLSGQKPPKYYPWNRGTHTTNFPIVGSSSDCAKAFIKGWKEAKPKNK